MTFLNCEQTQSLLSAYHDDELSPAQCREVESHLSGCIHCQSELKSFQALSRMAAQLQRPDAPDRWSELRKAVNTDHPFTSTAQVNSSQKNQFRAFYPALVASLIIAVGLAFWFASGHRHQYGLSINFDAYLTAFEKNPTTADQILVAEYHGIPVTFPQAIEKLGYRPAVVDHMPASYSLVSANLLKMPCCECLQATFRRSSGEVICVFEHDQDQPVWFGDRSGLQTQCDEKQCRLIQLDGHLAATWERKRKFITVVGVKTVQELLLLIQAFEGKSEI